MSEPSHAILVFNPLPWEREVGGSVPAFAVDPRGTSGDPTAGRHYADRHAASGDGGKFVIGPVTIPGFGYRVISPQALETDDRGEFDQRTAVTTDEARFVFDRERGGVKSWYDSRHNREWVDRAADWPLGGFVHESVADRDHRWPRDLLFRVTGDGTVDRALRRDYDTRGWQPDWHATRRGANRVTRHRVYETPLGIEVEQHLNAPGVEDAVLRFRPRNGELIVEAEWSMTTETHPEATYLVFPFDLQNPTPRVDVGGQSMVPGRDQIGRSCHDYYTAQRWVDISGAKGGITTATPLNPLVQLGGFRFAENRADAAMDRGLLLGWVTNNYWETNFRGHQPGRVVARYHLRPHGGFDEDDAHRHGLAAEHADPVVTTLAERPAAGKLPRAGCLLDLPEPPVLVLHVRPENTGAAGTHFLGAQQEREKSRDICLLLNNASDESQKVAVGSNIIRVQAARQRSLLGEDTIANVPVTKGSARFELSPRETVLLCLDCEG